jgi:ectoine hydroxylase-related dioxygenase (phytanoyl-CoA dioxygenase family)
MKNLSEEEIKYIFDTQGYIVLKKIIPDDILNKINKIFDHINENKLGYKNGVTKGKLDSDYNYDTDEIYLSNIVEQDPILYDLINIKPIIKIISLISKNYYRLNHTYSIQRKSPGSYTYLHMGSVPIHPKATYSCLGGDIFSPLNKVVFPIQATRKEDGCFAIIPGSHKANFERPWSNDPGENPLLIPLEVDPGDAIIFTEALAHGSILKRSDNERRTIYYCYSVGYMPDWGKMNLKFSDDFIKELNNEQREIVRIK